MQVPDKLLIRHVPVEVYDSATKVSLLLNCGAVWYGREVDAGAAKPRQVDGTLWIHRDLREGSPGEVGDVNRRARNAVDHLNDEDIDLSSGARVGPDAVI